MDVKFPQGHQELTEPSTFAAEPIKPHLTVQSVRLNDASPAPALLEESDLRLGTKPIPASRYYSRAYFELEKEKLWPKVWQFACWGQDIPNPGDVHVYRILDRSVLIVRQRDGSLKAFHNACLHRGREICEDHGHRTELKCPYHFFTWNLAGTLRWFPSKWDRLCIRQLRSGRDTASPVYGSDDRRLGALGLLQPIQGDARREAHPLQLEDGDRRLYRRLPFLRLPSAIPLQFTRRLQPAGRLRR